MCFTYSVACLSKKRLKRSVTSSKLLISDSYERISEHSGTTEGDFLGVIPRQLRRTKASVDNFIKKIRNGNFPAHLTWVYNGERCLPGVSEKRERSAVCANKKLITESSDAKKPHGPRSRRPFAVFRLSDLLPSRSRRSAPLLHPPPPPNSMPIPFYLLIMWVRVPASQNANYCARIKFQLPRHLDSVVAASPLRSMENNTRANRACRTKRVRETSCVRMQPRRVVICIEIHRNKKKKMR